MSEKVIGRFTIVQSSMQPLRKSLRDRDGNDVRNELDGFEIGEKIVAIPEDEYDRLTKLNDAIDMLADCAPIITTRSIYYDLVRDAELWRASVGPHI